MAVAEAQQKRRVEGTGRLAGVEKETIICFNEAERLAHIFTYNKNWQKHLEQKLGLKPVMKNRHGAREYEIDKSRICMPRAPRNLSDETKAKFAKQLADARQKRILSAKT